MQDRIWRWLKRQKEPVRIAEIVAALGISERAAINAMSRLRRGGYAVRAGTTHKSRWRATGSQVPEDGRGLSLNSIANLRPDTWHIRLPLANIARGQAASNVSLSRTIAQRNGLEFLRERAPAKSVQIPSLGDLASSLLGD